MTGNPLSFARMDNNTRVSFLGMIRQCLPITHHSRVDYEQMANRSYIDVPDIYFLDHCQVATWADSIGLGQFSPLFRYHLINGRKLLTLDAISLHRLGSSNMIANIQMENAIRDVSIRARRESESYQVQPYFVTQALTLGRLPPQRYHRELFQFTDPWLTENYNFVNISANDLRLHVKNLNTYRHYSNSRP
ncbi:unnamed protein product [Lymnaea stagnalis]|uniref:SAM domain-containing protein n=1 Tax=Lymnaea stagnalis TaxID=6523 RepID=A0AAV2HEC0_LYMST